MREQGTPSPLIVVLDANVLYPSSVRDTLLRGAEEGLYVPRISRQILEEVMRNLRRRPQITEKRAVHLETEVRLYFESVNALVTDYEALIPSLTNDEKDRHVLAAAIRAGAQIIVTFNLKDFPNRSLSPHEVVALHRDVFLTRLHALYPDELDRIVREQAAALTKPTRTVGQLLETLAQHTPGFVRLVRPRLLV